MVAEKVIKDGFNVESKRDIFTLLIFHCVLFAEIKNCNEISLLIFLFHRHVILSVQFLFEFFFIAADILWLV